MLSSEFLTISIGYLSIAFIIASTIVFWKYSLKDIATLEFIVYYLLLLLMTEISSKTLYHFEKNNLWILHLYTLLELIVLSLFYRRLLKNSKVILWMTIIASVFIIFNSIFLQNIDDFNTNARTLEQVIIIIYSILFFFYHPTQNITDKQLAQSLNLLNSAILIYFSGSLFVFMFSQIFIDKKEVYIAFWIFNAALALLFQLLVFISIWRIAFRRQISSNS